MTFQPQMQNSIQGFSVIGGLRRRAWNGMVADLWDVECAAYAGGRYVARDPRLFILLDQSGSGRPQVKMSPASAGGQQDSRTSPISYVPAGMELWVDIAGVRGLRHLDIHFDADLIASRLGEELDPVQIRTPRLLFHSEKAMALAALLAAEMRSDTPLHDLYGDGLALAVLIDLLNVVKTASRQRSSLSSWQLRRVQDYIRTHASRAIRLQELADLTGLSLSHFSHAFKASTGVAPHAWQMLVRIENAKRLLSEEHMPLAAVASEAGFADQAHFTRSFRKLVGTTPARWKNARR
ncbi:AraC family transcriptional regulator [Rhizobium sp. SSA_523]|uniref:helix-turn-helix domain-containing protein n=1 Tax=Rhizobium sp. SSA_523 TaxID=2952477 RepID=UPI00209014D1|nr:AraC family transcriptional regulator [Rhizobium sp. SSA_523]MCO5734228.1 AraC family transcriptional regulator [Rhizobium sp. SSA_523]WKC21495.1 AraC family transcriptional regulator [Rhizobium sp. SSA_523]